MSVSFDAVSSWFYRTSWQVGCLVVLLLIAQRVFQKHLSPRWRHNLWFLVVVRLLIPAIPPSPLSVFNFVPQPQKLAKLEATAVAVNRAEPSKVVEEAPVASVQNPPISSEPSTPLEFREPMVVSNSKTPPFPVSHSNPSPTIPWQKIAISVWTLGMAIFAYRLLYEFWKLKIHLRQANRIHDLSILNLLAQSQTEMGISKPIEIYETDRVQSPALFGFLKTVLLLPKGLLHDFSTPEIRYIFLHESGHLTRRDVGANWLLTALQIVHWFNPFVWIAFTRMRSDRELACDALVLERTKAEENNPYAKTIVKLLERFVRPSPVPGMIGILEEKNQMKNRIAMVISFAPRKSFSIAALAIGMLLGVTLLTDAQKITSVAIAPTVATDNSQKGDLWPPPLKITALVTETMFDRKDEVRISGSYRLTIYSSNSWWRIISDPVSYFDADTNLIGSRELPMRPENMFIMDAMPIPDGTRTIYFPRKRRENVMNLSTVNFGTVPQNQQGMLMAWLSYCPRPKLDLIDGEHMKKLFIQSENYTNELNSCLVSVEYLKPESLFISKLNTQNQGTGFGYKTNISFPAPFDHGWVDTRFEVTEATNVFGMRLPSKAVMNRYSRQPNAKSALDVGVIITLTSTLESVERMKDLPTVEGIFMADDARLGADRGDSRHYYSVTNDQWLPLDSDFMKGRIRMVRSQNIRKQREIDEQKEWFGEELNSSSARIGKNPAFDVVVKRLDAIRIQVTHYDHLPLKSVARDLYHSARRGDPEGTGFNFIFNYVDDAPKTNAAPFLLDEVKITVPELRDSTLRQVLEAIVSGADQPITFTVGKQAVAFKWKAVETKGKK